MSPITKDQWKSLHPKAQWDVTVALRGPDVVHSDTLKWFTSGVIRAAVEGIVRPEGGSATINRQLDFVVLTHGGNPAITFPSPVPAIALFDATHFLHHVSEAACILDIPALFTPGAVYWEAMGKSSVEAAAIRILEWLKAEADRPSMSIGRRLHEQITALEAMSAGYKAIKETKKPWKPSTFISTAESGNVSAKPVNVEGM